MSKGNSGLLSKHQAKLEYTGEGTIGNESGYEVLTEVALRLRSNGVKNEHRVAVYAKIATDHIWEQIAIISGPVSDIVNISSWDYVRFECTVYQNGVNTQLYTSAFMQDGIFLENVVKDMSDKLSQQLLCIEDSICGIKEQIISINRQIELITDHEEEEFK